LALLPDTHGNSGHAAHDFNFVRVAERSSWLARIRMRNEGQYSILDLAPSTGITRADVGEVRGSEAFDLLQLLNTGHAGTISTIHANSAREGLSRFTSCVLQSGIEIPFRAIKSSIADSLNVVVHVERRPGRRTISEVVEVKRYDPDPDVFECNSIFQKAEVVP